VRGGYRKWRNRAPRSTLYARYTADSDLVCCVSFVVSVASAGTMGRCPTATRAVGGAACRCTRGPRPTASNPMSSTTYPLPWCQRSAAADDVYRRLPSRGDRKRPGFAVSYGQGCFFSHARRRMYFFLQANAFVKNNRQKVNSNWLGTSCGLKAVKKTEPAIT